MNRIIVLCSMLFAAVTFSLTQQYSGSRADIERILERSARFSDFIVQGQYDSLAATYTEDAKILPPITRIIEGRDSIKKYWGRNPDITTIHHRAVSSELNINGDLAYDYGYYEGTTRQKDGTETPFKGKYVILWKRIHNDWFMYLDMWNPVR